MKNSQVYFIHQCHSQYFDFNTAEESHEFRFHNLLSGFR
jgi:hypothetical protein